MKIIIGCEFSQIITKAFRKKGHEAYSCDLLPTEGNSKWHFQIDILELLKKNKFDLGIFHPPCTYLANCGLHYLKTQPKRYEQLQEAFNFILKLWKAEIDKICIENPVGWLNTHWKKPSQIIQPYYFGESELKTTCLWLKSLPLLKHYKEGDLFDKKTHTIKPLPIKYILRKTGEKKGQKYNYYFRQGKTAKQRSRTFLSIAKAMADQWNFS